MTRREIILSGALLGCCVAFVIIQVIGGISQMRDTNRCAWFSEVVHTAEGSNARFGQVVVMGRCPDVLPPLPRPTPRGQGLWIDYTIQGPTYLDAHLDICLRHGEIRILPGAMIPAPGFKCPKGVKKP